MPHRNAPLSELGRLKLARFHVESGASIRATAERFQVSTTTVIRWSRRYRAVLVTGQRPTVADMADASSRPHRCPTRAHRRIEKKAKHLRTRRRLDPVQIAGRVGIPASTVHRILVRQGPAVLAADPTRWADPGVEEATVAAGLAAREAVPEDSDDTEVRLPRVVLTRSPSLPEQVGATLVSANSPSPA